MAIEYKLKGDFAVDDTLKRCLLGALGDDSSESEPAGSGLVFQLVSALVLVVGFYTEEAPNGSMLFFRVLDKDRVAEATTLTIACVAAVLEHLHDENAELWRDEVLLMQRTHNRVRVIEPGKVNGRPFWNNERRRILGVHR